MLQSREKRFLTKDNEFVLFRNHIHTRLKLIQLCLKFHNEIQPENSPPSEFRKECGSRRFGLLWSVSFYFQDFHKIKSAHLIVL